MDVGSGLATFIVWILGHTDTKNGTLEGCNVQRIHPGGAHRLVLRLAGMSTNMKLNMKFFNAYGNAYHIPPC